MIEEVDQIPMKGCAPNPKHPIRFPAYASIKYDGIRCIMLGNQPRTNQLKEIPNLYTRARLQACEAMWNKDFEFILGDPADPLCYNKTNSAVMTIKGEPEVDFYVFDCIDDINAPFERRLAAMMATYDLRVKGMKIVQQVLVEDQDGLDKMYARVTAAGHEGLILKSPTGVYKHGRSTAKEQLLLKLKPEHDSEFDILGCYEAMENTNEAFTNELGRTDRSTSMEGLVPKGMLGGFNARDIHTGVEFNCAPGKLSHDERVKLWLEWLANPEAIKAKLGKYRSFPIGVLNKPRHPRWIAWADRRAV